MHRFLPPAARILIGFQVASFPTKSYRDWPLESFAELGTRIIKNFDCSHTDPGR
jgi:heptosyltransferase-3